ncbi:acetylcholinesterase-like [Dermacentor variabilis]|uniref:acetylcholinesterase-like n=1 Tax=Dermacentor variabilis TaxID=34621 RepID=UPI003F5CA1C9
MTAVKVCLLASLLVAAVLLVAAKDSPKVRIDSGFVVGTRVQAGGTEVDAFLGIPYAEPPIGELRFRRPRPVSPWEGPYNATSKPSACRQVPFDLLGPLALDYSGASEDCLHVNVWRPARGQECATTRKRAACRNVPLPTVVFIHGGAFQWGDSALFLYDPANFVALEGDVVFVTFNYRVSMFGFLDAQDPESGGNLGLWDQNLVLKWVNNNIAHFGGDPARITLWGQSAGAMSVALHAQSSHSVGLFQKAIMQSGAPFSLILNKVFNTRASFNNIVSMLKCSNITNESAGDQLRDVMYCLRQAEASSVFEEIQSTRILQRWFVPIENDTFFPHPFMTASSWEKFGVRDVLIGTTVNEGTMFYNMVLRAFPALSDAQPDEHRMLGAAALSMMFEMPLSKARLLADMYYGEDDANRTYEQARDITAEIVGDVFLDCPTELFADAAAMDEVRVYRYLFAHKASHSFVPAWMGVAHGADLLYTLGSLPLMRDQRRYTEPLGNVGKRFLQTQDYTKDEEIFMKEIVEAFAHFIRNGKPEFPSAGFEWPAYTAESRQLLVLKPRNYSIMQTSKTEICDLWKKAVVTSDGSTQLPLAAQLPREPQNSTPPKKKWPGAKPSTSASSIILPWELFIVIITLCLL